MGKRLLTSLICLALIFGIIPCAAAADETNPLLIAQGIIDWKKADIGISAGDDLLCGKFSELAGSTAGDWYPVGLSRLGKADNYAEYLAVLKDRVEKRYRQSGKLSAVKATEWHRLTLAVLAAGGDPTSFGTDENGQPINLIADGTYDRGKTTSLGRQGINGWIWALITLDTKRYEIPENAYNTRDDIIDKILSSQLPDGGWALGGGVSDPDMTAMALQALAPYVGADAKVQKAADDALLCLSALQLPTGDYESWGTRNVESTDQVIIALCCLGIDPMRDARFIKNGNTLLSGVLRYRRPDGGFVHSYDYDENNPASLPDMSNSMAGEQTLLAMAALWRLQNGMRTLYDFRLENEKSDAEVVFSDADIKAVNSLPEKLTTKQYVTVTALLDKLERSADFAEKDECRRKLAAAKEQIAKIQAEIDDINAQIREKLYPFESISIRDKKTVDLIVSRYNALDDDDRVKIERWEDVIKTKTQVDGLLRALIIGIVLGTVAFLLFVLLVFRIYRKRRRKAKETERFFSQFADED